MSYTLEKEKIKEYEHFILYAIYKITNINNKVKKEFLYNTTEHKNKSTGSYYL